MRKSSHLFDRLPKPSCREPVWSAHLEVVRRKFFRNVSSKNIGPGFTPDSLREHVIIGAQFFFNAPRERAAYPAVTIIGAFVLTKILDEFHLAFPRLKPCHFLSNRAQYFASNTDCEWSDRFIASDGAISKL
jgi:hypothetical protein